MPKAWYNRLVDMLASRFGVLIRNSKWNQHVRLFQPRRALPPDEPLFRPDPTKRPPVASNALTHITFNADTEASHEFTVCPALVIRFLAVAAGRDRGLSRAPLERCRALAGCDRRMM